MLNYVFLVLLCSIPSISIADSIKKIEMQPFLTSYNSRDFFQVLASFNKTRTISPENPHEVIEIRSYTSRNNAFSIICQGKSFIGSTITEASCTLVFDLSKSGQDTEVQSGKLFGSMSATLREENTPGKFFSAANNLFLSSVEKVKVVMPNGSTAEYPRVRMDCEQVSTYLAKSCTFVGVPDQN